MYIQVYTYVYVYVCVSVYYFFSRRSVMAVMDCFPRCMAWVPRRALGMGMSSLIIALGAETCDWQSCPKIYWNIDQYRSYRIDIEEQLEGDYREAGKMVQRMNESKLQEPLSWRATNYINSTTSHLSFRLFFCKEIWNSLDPKQLSFKLSSKQSSKSLPRARLLVSC